MFLRWEEKCKIAIFTSETFDSRFVENQKKKNQKKLWTKKKFV